MSNSIVLILPSRFHTPFHYAHLALHLNTSNHQVSILDLPSNDPSSPAPSSSSSNPYASDVQTIREAILSHTQAGRDVVLVVHGHSGISGSEAAFGLEKRDGNDGVEGGVVKLVFVSAVVLEEGKGLDGLDLPVVAEPIEENPNLLHAKNPETNFYHDVPTNLTSRAISNLTSASSTLTTFSTPSNCAWRSIPSLYILCTEDVTLPVSTAEAMVDTVRRGGGEVRVERLKSGHCPFLSVPASTARLIAGFIGVDVIR